MRKAALISLSFVFVLATAYAVEAQTGPTLDQRVADLESRVSVIETHLGIVPPAPSPSPSATPTGTPSPSGTPSPTPSPSPSPTPLAYPPPSTETGPGVFRLSCAFSHRAQVDPIVAPGPAGTMSAHLHDFFGNRSTASDSTYASMVAASTTCSRSADTASYWAPSLIAPDGTAVKPAETVIYYRNRPALYGTTVPFPPDFRMIAGFPTTASSPVTYWTCDGESDTALETRKTFVPNCGTKRIVVHVFFPACWDGVRLDSADHRSHVAYPRGPANGAITNINNNHVCPPTHPVKIPQVDFRIVYPVRDGTGYHFADGQTVPHADFWNTWQQATLESLTRDCLHAGIPC